MYTCKLWLTSGGKFVLTSGPNQVKKFVSVFNPDHCFSWEDLVLFNYHYTQNSVD